MIITRKYGHFILYSLKKNRLSYLLVLAYLLVVTIYFFLFLKSSPLVIYSSNQKNYYQVFNDEIDNGNSTIDKVTETSQGLKIDYTLRKGFIHPYMIAVFNGVNKILDVSKYNKLHIEVGDNHNVENLFVYISTVEKNVKNKAHRLADRHSNVLISTSKTKYIFDINLNEFTTPLWWFETLKQNPESFDNIAFDKLKSISVTSGVSPLLNTHQTFTVKSIYFYTDYSTFINYTVAIFILLIAGIFGTKRFKKYLSSNKTLEIQYKPMSVLENTTDDKILKCLNYIQTNYSNPDLSLYDISMECGVSERAISKSISEQFDTNFKTYLNKIRIEESKRLMENSQLNLSEIAYLVGFNSPSTFTKVFNKIEGVSPTVYLSQMSK